MLSTFKNAWKIPQLRKKMLFTLFMLLLYRLGSHIAVPFMNTSVIEQLFNGANASLFAFMDLMAGGNFRNFTIFACNIYPYVTASIVLQLLTIAIPSLEALAKEGDTGRKAIAKYTRYLAIAIAAVQAVGYTFGIFRQAVNATTYLEYFTIIISIVAGSTILIWIGEQITEHGIGNGISILIFAGIVARFPVDIFQSIARVRAGLASSIYLWIFLVLAIAICVFVVILNEGERRIPVQYAKRVVGRKMYGGQATHIPIKVLLTGVMPIIFANSLLAIPSTVAMFTKNEATRNWITKWLSPSGGPGVVIYVLCSVILIIFFTFFYTTIQFNTVEYSKNMQQNGGFIPGIRPGKPTSEYLQRSLNRLVLPGAIALAILSVLPTILTKISNLQFNYGGTSIIIVVGVVLETTRVLEQQLLMRNYKGFLRK
ncbi:MULTISPECIES: preprotein translocase subunit SecY [Peptoniphilus]|uniref:Protein translocase subunit SecY n=1 Tax=Peptoniphilus lacrimalis TaxID=33031 RepID=A0A379C545_9FIRM|nr:MULTISPECIES: preprotein translocase subunit SecY [Peptoniphilus]EFK38551.1 preprotein translocase, SecY subunit [Peptoniphilus sp. oral taxon 836 str. F0141]MDK7722791.1 preprotein translocase subunit SecY [Peptoniphilus lacrimalis]MDK7732223.1 preprotein translocase subunit SecY [Peptoniphilus lacrimalis]SUB56855.1 preprotein translocase subunit SecY [Peptoniphilus lacrimalis]